VRILSAIVETASGFPAPFISIELHCGPAGWAFVRDCDLGIFLSPHCFLLDVQRRNLVTFLCNERLKDFPFLVHGMLEIVSFTSDLGCALPSADEELIWVPTPLRAPPHRL
jgi:hypothetical protein